jgi:hypothetical protein
MGRRRWQGSEEQEQVLMGLARRAEESRQVEDSVWADAQKARDLGIPDTVICQRADLSRTTLQRKLGTRARTEPGE